MNSVVSDKPYVPVPPYHGTLWPRALNLYFPRYLRRRYGTAKVEIVGAEKLRASIAAGHGVLITPNHCRDEDPFIVSALAREVGRPFFVVASAHLFMGSKLQAFLLRRAGAFSIYREGMDKQAVQTSIEILETAERPLVIFPEGHISRTNDRLTPMLEGTALIARQAAKKRAQGEQEGRRPSGRAALLVSVRRRRGGGADAGRDRDTPDLAAEPRHRRCTSGSRRSGPGCSR